MTDENAIASDRPAIAEMGMKAAFTADPVRAGAGDADRDAGAEVFFGGPERPRRLRDLLEERVRATPPGGEILWVTYYFRDRGLADALRLAHRRGVIVRIVLEGTPRLRRANEPVIRMLSDPVEGIGAGLRIVRRSLFRHLHEKLYCFSHPHPVALVGSFNPSGDEPEDERVVRRIGDQDRGHNFLVELPGPAAASLRDHALRLFGMRRPIGRRFLAEFNRPAGEDRYRAYFFPRLRNPLTGLLRGAAPGTRLRIAASHLRDGGIATLLADLTGKGVDIELLTEATERRVPPRIERLIVASGIAFERYRHPDDLPMHSKFMLADGPDGRWLAFGSFNLTRTSRWLNHEILMVTTDEALFDAFSRRWDEMKSENASAARPA